MKVAYIFSTSGHTASYKLGKMILPQLEDGRHGADVTYGDMAITFCKHSRGDLPQSPECIMPAMPGQ